MQFFKNIIIIIQILLLTIPLKKKTVKVDTLNRQFCIIYTLLLVVTTANKVFRKSCKIEKHKYRPYLKMFNFFLK